MGTWEIIPPDGVTATTIEGDKFNVVFGNRSNLQSQTYTIKYTDGDYCGQTTVTQPGGAQPPAPPTECVAGTWTTTSTTETVLSNAYGCTNENGSWEGGGNLTVEIRNNSNYYIPFNGEIKDKQPKDIEHHFRVPSYVTSNGAYYWYGRVTDKGQDSNFLVPPHATATLSGCMETFSEGTYHFYISILEGNDYKLHNEDLSLSGEVSVSYDDNKVIFTIPAYIDGTRWRGDGITDPWGATGDFHYALTLAEVTGSTHCSRFHYKSKDKQGNWVQKVRIVPVHLNPNVDWVKLQKAITEKDADGNYNLNKYYPYTIKEN